MFDVPPMFPHREPSILAALRTAGAEGLTYYELAQRVYDVDAPTAGQQQSMRRAVQRLRRKLPAGRILIGRDREAHGFHTRQVRRVAAAGEPLTRSIRARNPRHAVVRLGAAQ